MNKIVRVFEKGEKSSVAVGYIINDDESTYIIRVQNGSKNEMMRFHKDRYSIKSIYEEGGSETYQIKRKNMNGEVITLNLPKACYGGCG